MIRNASSIAFVALCFLLGPGCGQQAPPLDPQAAAEHASDTRQTPASLSTRETWDAIYLQGHKIGWMHTRLRPDNEDPRIRMIETRFESSLERFGQRAEQRLLNTSWETLEGRLLRFVTESYQGANPVRTEGTVQQGQLHITTLQGGRTERAELAWGPTQGGFYAVELSLLEQPLQPGEQRTIHALQPIVHLVARCDLTAQNRERLRLPTGEIELLRIEQRQSLPGLTPIESVLWCDTAGEILKQQIRLSGQEILRTTREVAERREPGAAFDLGTHSSVLVVRPLKDPHAAQQAVYRITMRDGVTPQSFPPSATQQLKPLDAKTLELTVRVATPTAGPIAPATNADQPTAADRQPSGMIQSDDPGVVKLAQSITADDSQPRQVAAQLEQLVHRTITHKNLSQTFVSAAETLASGEGDCTEHAVLLAALLRARQLPARTVAGLVYADSLPGFAFHMWTEAYLDGQWIGLDGTLGRGAIGVGHIKLAHTSLDNSAALTALLPVMQVLGRLQIEIQSLD